MLALPGTFSMLVAFAAALVLVSCGWSAGGSEEAVAKADPRTPTLARWLVPAVVLVGGRRVMLARRSPDREAPT